jgi:DNA repair exonuclease SbcCD ATPase subunit
MNQNWISEVVSIREKLNEDKAALRYHTQRLADTERKIKLEERHEVTLKKCRVVLQSMAFKTVLEDPYLFEAIFETKHNETECRLVFKQDGEERDPLDSTSGGAVDVAAFTLRAAIQRMICSRSTLFLDEPFRNISEDRYPFVVDLLKTINKRLSLQLIIITHKKGLIDRADKVITIRKGKITGPTHKQEEENYADKK